MIDSEGYRPNVGIVLVNNWGQVLWARRIGQNAWQFPQGGIKENEHPEQALYRELQEEVGLDQDDVRIIGQTKGWLRYKLPRQFQRRNSSPLCIGQKQKWYLLRMLCPEERISFKLSDTPEFEDWRWVSYWYPISQVVLFKRDVYRKALKELAPWVEMTL